MTVPVPLPTAQGRNLCSIRALSAGTQHRLGGGRAHPRNVCARRVLSAGIEHSFGGGRS